MLRVLIFAISVLLIRLGVGINADVCAEHPSFYHPLASVAERVLSHQSDTVKHPNNHDNHLKYRIRTKAWDNTLLLPSDAYTLQLSVPQQGIHKFLYKYEFVGSVLPEYCFLRGPPPSA
jgi:hypothetical protein